MADATLTPTDGLRARNKLDKLRRIKEVAQSLFVAKGFDDTTMREIAVRAGVGLGTIFLYAKDKRDLLFLTINEPLDHITEQAENLVDPKAPLIENLLAVAKLHYHFFGQQPALARLALREMIFYDSGEQAASFQKIRERLIRLFGRAIELAITNAEIAPREPSLFAGWTLFCIFQVELRRWLASDVTHLRAGLRELERAFRLLIVGFGIPLDSPCKRPLTVGNSARKSPGRR
ncbi:MAG TPA: TetR/AcrR family transcriptional regulator [Xanthobacteraceae bacterium]|nr:TetR/AcrR family transcriptional regulator [Xanthobacteraceae bacterium]